MHRMKWFCFLLVGLAAIHLFPGKAMGNVAVYCLDTSGSMKCHGFEAAKDVLIEHINATKLGEVIYVIAFHTNDYLIGRLAVGENTDKDREVLIDRVKELKANGKHTNIDEPLQAAKALLLEERAPGKRKIVVLSDGISDPSPDHESVDLKTIAEIIPQESGWSVYIVGLPDDIAGLFQTSQLTGIVTHSETPHVKGIPLEKFSHENIKEAVEAVKKDDMASSSTTPQDKDTPLEKSSHKDLKDAAGTVMKDNMALSHSVPIWPLFLVAGVIFFASGCFYFSSRKTSALNFVLEINYLQTGETVTQPMIIHEKEIKSVGPQGNIIIQAEGIPPVVFSLMLKKGILWLSPLDSVRLNGKGVTEKVPVSLGDIITLRQLIKLTIIEEGGTNKC